MVRLLPLLLALLSTVALAADWTFHMRTKARDDFEVGRDEQGAYLYIEGTTSRLTDDEAENLAKALLWAAGKKDAAECPSQPPYQLQPNIFVPTGATNVGNAPGAQ